MTNAQKFEITRRLRERYANMITEDMAASGFDEVVSSVLGTCEGEMTPEDTRMMMNWVQTFAEKVRRLK